MYLGGNTENTICNFKDKSYVNNKEEIIPCVNIDNKPSL